MLQDEIKDAILDHLGPLKHTSGDGWRTRNCPLCHTQGESVDTRGRFGIRFPSSGDIAVNCFNCRFQAVHTPGSLFSRKFKIFLREIGVSAHDIAQFTFALYREKHNVVSTIKPKLAKPVTSSWETTELPENSYTLRFWLNHCCSDASFLKVMGYLEERCLRHVDDFYWSPSTDRMMNRRVIIPCWYEGRVVGYTARFVGNNSVLKVPKYMASAPKGYVYNLDPQLTGERKFTIMVEGVFDAFNVNGIGILGNDVSPEQLTVIKKIPSRIIVMPDLDAPGEALVKTAMKEGWAVSFPPWKAGIKDASRAVELYGRLAVVKSILDAAENDSFSIQVKYELKKEIKFKNE